MKTIIASILFVFSIALFAGNEGSNSTVSSGYTNTLKGKVIDKTTGEGVAGACVKLEGSSKSVYSDFEGNFEISNCSPGNYNLVTSLISYEKKSESVKIGSVETQNVVSVVIDAVK